MIDLNTYRMRIGCFNPRGSLTKKEKYKLGGLRYHDYNMGYNILFYILYIYFIILMMCVSQLILILGLNSDTSHYSLYYSWAHPIFIMNQSNRDLPLLSTIHTKLLYVCIISCVLKEFVAGLHVKYCKKYRLQNFTPANIFFGSKSTRFRQLISIIIIYIMALNFLLIAIINPSMLSKCSRPNTILSVGQRSSFT